jgi:hypothetical protein
LAVFCWATAALLTVQSDAIDASVNSSRERS